MIKKVMTAASIALVATASPAFAGPDNVPTKKVSYADLDLSTPEGLAALDRRIDSAARKVCFMDEIRTSTRLKRQGIQECYAKAKASAANQVASIAENKRLGG